MQYIFKRKKIFVSMQYVLPVCYKRKNRVCPKHEVQILYHAFSSKYLIQ